MDFSSGSYSSGSYIQFESEDKTGRFLSVSLAVHAGLFFLASLIALPIVEHKMTEVIAFEIVNPVPKSVTLPILTATKSPPARAEKQLQPKIVQTRSVPAPKPTSHPQPQGIDDIIAPNLDETATQIASTTVGTLDEKDLANDLDRIDTKTRQDLTKEQKQLAAQTQNLRSQSEKDLAALDLENREQGVRLQKAAAALRARNQAQATQSSSGSVAATGAQMAGSSQGFVRKLGDLKQMAGNPQPEFSPQERLLGHQGRARFLAYVSDEGKLSEFKLLESTGYRNLDSKTLAALKKWRFYPGQEGWVEIPTQWSLTGGAEEQPTLLRRSQN